MIRLTAFLSAALLGSLALAGPQGDYFESKVRPLLAENCFGCHADSKMGGLRVDSREALLEGGSRGPAIVPGEPSASRLLQAVLQADPDLKMPPGGKLDEEQIAILDKWLEDGAVWPQAPAEPALSAESGVRPEDRKFWSFQPVRKPAAPEVRRAGWVRNGVDRFVLARLEEADLAPVEEADKRTLIRRTTFDLTGLPPTPEEVAAFLADDSPDAFAKVVDRLLASPRYGERWARRWLDLARYGDGVSSAQVDTPLPNAWRYRDWVIEAFNADLPYDRFIRAQLAADLIEGEGREERLPALGFHALKDRDDDRVDVTTRVFLGLTVGCAQCHDHKFDPIPTQDFYSLQGIFSSSEQDEFPLVAGEQVEKYKQAKAKVAEKQVEIDRFLSKQTDLLVDAFMTQTPDYLVAAWRIMTDRVADAEEAAKQAELDQQTLERWIDYLKLNTREHPYLDEWDEFLEGDGDEAQARALAEAFSRELSAIHKEKRAIDDRNYVKLGGADGVLDQRTLLSTNLEFIDPVKWYLWRDLAAEKSTRGGVPFGGGVYHYDSEEIRRFLSGVWLDHLESQEVALAALEEAVPELYPFLHTLRDADEPKDLKVAIRGDKENLGELAPRRFLAILSDEERPAFQQGSGRLELANAIASATNPLTARVMVNRVWQRHFGRGIVGTHDNFGRLGERPTHPELLDYLAARFVESGWSIKAIEREIVLSAAYRLSSRIESSNYEKDPDNHLLWRFRPVQRLDAEALRDSIVAVAGRLDMQVGGPPAALTDDDRRRALYGEISRTTPDPTLTLFDFPDPKASAAERSVTVGPLQRLYFLNDSFVIGQAKALAARLAAEAGPRPEARISRAYELLYSRPPSAAEIEVGVQFASEDDWAQYAQALLASSEFWTVQ